MGSSGLSDDNAAVHPQQHQLWYELNICCLAIFQRQKDLAQALLQTDTPPPSTCLSMKQIEIFGLALIEIGDKLENHGLVDYEVGIWEEEILSGESVRHIISCSRY